MGTSATHSSLWIEPWFDLVTDETGHDPRSNYVEQYWLGVIGPTATWLLRYTACEFDRSPEGFELPFIATCLQLGLNPRPGPRNSLTRTLDRLVAFRLASPGHAGYAIRRYLPMLSSTQIRRLPEHLQRSHSSQFPVPRVAF